MGALKVVRSSQSRGRPRGKRRACARIRLITPPNPQASRSIRGHGLLQEAVQHVLNSIGIAYYLHRGDRYDLSVSAGANGFAQTYRFNDGVPLRLRRWQEFFEVDDESDERLHMLFVPMTVRGDLLGFLCCGPKPDRTAYLEDETTALSLLAHHTAIAAALLPHTAAPESTGLAAPSSLLPA